MICSDSSSTIAIEFTPRAPPGVMRSPKSLVRTNTIQVMTILLVYYKCIIQPPMSFSQYV